MEHAPEPSGNDNTGLAGKVFGLGLARTGTTSMHQAMLELGLRSAPDSIPLVESIDVAFLGRYDAFFDNPIPFRYQALDAVCPGSRFIVTHRDLDSWLASMEFLFGPGLDRLDPSMRAIGDAVHRRVYGTVTFDRDRLAALHERHYRELRSWLGDRPHVWMDLDDGFEWSPVCGLLDLPEPTTPFPRANRRGRWWQNRRR